jgi:hypothetical protein
MKRLLLLLGAAMAMAGCGVLPRRPLVLATDRPEVTPLVEYFNSLQPGQRVLLRYQSEPAQALHGSGGVDLVVGDRLGGVGEAHSLEPLDDLFRANRLPRSEFYAPVLAAGAPERRQVLLPLSFSLEAIVFLPYNLQEPAPNLGISLDFLKNSGRQYNQSVRDSLVREGFSPLWDPGFLFDAVELGGAHFREESGGNLGWNAESLERSVAYLRDWVAGNGGLGTETAFAEKYLYLPLGRLLDEKRILFYPVLSSRLPATLDDQKEEADFRWLAGPEKILVADDILFIGVPRRSKHKQQAKAFLFWTFQERTQSKLLEIGRRQRLGIFGIAGGFSALKSVNERELPQYYPRLIGRIPPEELLQVPGPLPEAWPQIKAQVLLPWLRQALSAETAPKDLGERLKAARLGRGRK